MFKFYNKLKIKVSKEELWNFLSYPKNLELITPDNMNLKLLNHNSMDKMYEGMTLEFAVKPILNVPIKWKSKILKIDEGSYFIDKQVEGPYGFWEHCHIVEESDDLGYSLLIDEINYSPPLGIFAPLIDKLIVKNKMKEMFHHRNSVLSSKYEK